MMSLWNKYKTVTCVYYIDDLQRVDCVLESLNAEIGIAIRTRFVFLTEKKRPKEGFGIYNDCVFISRSDLNYNGKLKNKQLLSISNNNDALVILLGNIPKRFFKLLKTKELSALVTVNSENDFAKINFQTNSVKPNEMLSFAKNTLLKISD